MAYLGHKPAVGENNSFRILDDISSFVLTFDGSSASVVGLSDETITITENNHRFITGQRVTYSNGGGGNITGLVNGQAYFVINHSKTQIKLASSASNALAGTAINLTGLGTGSSHTLTLAFDGVNTKFDPTFGNGMHDTLIKRAAQLVISINGVIQQPHDTATPSTGFGVDSLGHIIFSTAPASTDIFWGHILASNTVTFDSSDNDVDTFTGNGSTTSFTLSKTPPDNRNILVTIDGVVQYPSDAANTRSYNVSENVMTFVAAPGLGTVIQVRHIGYAGVGAGGGGGGVTGFYGRTGNVSLTSTDNITVNDAAITGNASITGNLTVDGDTTTLNTTLREVELLRVDATNDTLAAGIVTQRGSGDILNLYDNSSEVFSVIDGGDVGIARSIFHLGDTNTHIGFANNDTIRLQTDGTNKLSIGSSITSTTAITIYNAEPELTFRDSNHSPYYYSFRGVAGSFNLSDSVNGDRMRFSANGSTSVVAPTFVMTGAAQVSTNLGVTGNLILSDQIQHDGDTDTKIRFPAADQISFETGGTNRLKIHTYSSNNHVELDASTHLSLADNGSNGRFIYMGDANASSTGYMHLQPGAGSQGFGGGIRLYSHANGTNPGGVYIGKSLNSSGAIIFGNGGMTPSTEYARITSGGQVAIGMTNHTGSNTKLVVGTGSTTVDAVAVINTNDQDVDVIRLSNFDGSTTTNKLEVHFDCSGIAGFDVGIPAATPVFEIRNTSGGGGRFRLKNDGRLLINTTTEGNASADDLTIATSGSTGITIRSGTSNAGNIYFSDGTSGADEYVGYISYSHSTNSLSFGTNDGTEKLGINSVGDLLLGNHGSRIFDDSSGTNVVVDIYGGTTAGKRGILALGGRTGSDDADIGTIQFLNENNSNATASNHVQSKLVASIDVKSQTTTSNSGANSGSHLIFSTKGENAALTEALRISSDGFIGINDTTPYTGLTINKEGDYWDTNGNTYAHPEGRVLSTWRGDRNDDTDYWVGFVGKYLKPSATVNILLQPHVGNFNNQAGMYVAGEATGNYSSVLTIGKIISGNVAGRGTTASSGKRASKSEILRVNHNTKILHTRADNTTRYDVEFRNTGGISDGNYGGLQFTQGGSGTTNLAAMQIAYNNTGRPDIVFHHRDRGGGNALQEAFRIQSNGNIGIDHNDPQTKLHVAGSISGGTSNQPFLRFFDSQDRQRNTKHYFKCVRGSTTIFDILTVDLNSNFHQAMIILYYGTRLQNIGVDHICYPTHKIIGVNRFNGGSIGFTKQTIHQDSNVATYADIDAVATSSTNYRIRLTFGSVGGSSFACGSVEIIGVGSGNDGAFYSLSHSHGLLA